MEISREQGQVQVRRCTTSKHAEQYALVLSAMGINSLIAPHEGAYLVLVASEDVHRADYELDAYDRENMGKPETVKPAPRTLPGLEVPLIYWAVLLFFFAAARQDAFSLDWVRQGAAQAGLRSLKG